MRTLKLHFPDEALPTLDTYLKQTKEARVFRRAQAVREVVKGQRLQTVSDALHLTYSALRKWVHRFAHQGIQGLVDRPRPGRPPKVTCALAKHLDRLVDEDPPPPWCAPCPVELSGTRDRLGPPDRRAGEPRKRPRGVKKN